MGKGSNKHRPRGPDGRFLKTTGENSTATSAPPESRSATLEERSQDHEPSLPLSPPAPTLYRYIPHPPSAPKPPRHTNIPVSPIQTRYRPVSPVNSDSESVKSAVLEDNRSPDKPLYPATTEISALICNVSAFKLTASNTPQINAVEAVLPPGTIQNITLVMNALGNDAAPYTADNWLQDACAIDAIVNLHADGNQFADLYAQLTPQDQAASRAVLRTADPSKLPRFKTRALANIMNPAHELHNPQRFMTFMVYFRSGPNVWEEEEMQGREHRPGTPAPRQEMLGPKDLEYDGTTPVSSYLNRLDFMAGTYGSEAVLAKLPKAMINDARVWFDSVSVTVKNKMNHSLDLWKTQLRDRFKKDASTAIQQADRLTHDFNDESEYDVRQYLSKKQALYQEAGEESEDLIVRRMHAGLDPTLALSVTLKTTDNTIDHFLHLVYGKEATARAYHEKQAQERKAVRKEAHQAKQAAESYQPRYIPRQAARTLSPVVQTSRFGPPAGTYPRFSPYAQQNQYVNQPNPVSQYAAAPAPVNTRTQTPNNQQPSEPGRQIQPYRPQPAAQRAPYNRERYPCSYCRSLEHIDPECPLHPKRRRQPLPAQATAYYTTYDDDFDMVEVDEHAYQTWAEAYHTPGYYEPVEHMTPPPRLRSLPALTDRPDSLISVDSSDASVSENESSGQQGGLSR